MVFTKIRLHVHILTLHAVRNLSCNWDNCGYVKIILLFCSELYNRHGLLSYMYDSVTIVYTLSQ